MNDYYENKERESEHSIRICWYAFIICVILLFIGSLFSSCTTTKYVEVEKVHTDTIYKSKVERDSVFFHDSIYMKEYAKGDTVFIVKDRWHEKWKEVIKTDTLYKSKVDSIPVPYPKEVYVEKKLAWWQKGLMYIGLISVISFILFLIFKLRR